jgi:membrane protease YdiL (CAAX protease family)
VQEWSAQVAQVPPPPADLVLPPPPRGRVPWGPGLALLATAVILLVDGVLAGLTAAISLLLGDLYVAVGSLAVLAGGSWLAVRDRPLGGPALLGRRPRWGDVGVGVLGGLVVLALDRVVEGALAPVVPLGSSGSQEWIDTALAAAPVLTTIAIVLTGPVAEEVLFRGLLHRGLRSRLPAVGAALLSSAVFAAVHPGDLSPASLVLLAQVFLAGLVFAGLLELRGTLVAPVVAHVVVNAVATALPFIAGIPDWIVPVGPDERVGIFQLDEGACADGFPDASSGGWTAASEAACDGPHDIEVYAVGEAGAPAAAYPGEVALSDRVTRLCAEAFEPYVEAAWEDSRLDYLAVIPSEEAWEAGDRALRCVLHDLEREPLEGSARGSGW